MDTLINDLRYAWRMLRKTKGLTLVAIISLAVGIGANSAIFSVVNSILFKPRPVAEPEQLVQLYVGHRQSPYEQTSYPSYLDLKERNAVFTDLAAYSPAWQFNLSRDDNVVPVWGEVVSGNYFDVLGVKPFLGRTFLAEENEAPGRNPVVVIGFALWQRNYAGDTGIIGRTITINNQPLTVIGVAPAEYTGMMAGLASEIWVPMMTMPLIDPGRGERRLLGRGSRWLTMVGRLAPGRSIEEARSQFAVLTHQMQTEHPDEWKGVQENGEVRELFITVLPERATRIHPGLRAPTYALVGLLFAVVDLVLVIACMNLASMFFARAVARRREITVRLALGAARSRIVRQLLTESLLLALIAGTIGTVLALWGLSALVTSLPVLPEGVRLGLDIQTDWKVLAYSVLFSVLTGLLFGLAPALHASAGTISAVLKEEGGITARFRRSRVRSSLVLAQVAISLLLLVGAGLVLRSLEKVRPTRLGFSSRDYLVTFLSLDESTYDRARSQQFFQELTDHLAGLPGVRTVSLVEGMPGGFMSRSRRSTIIEGYTAADGESLEIDAIVVGPRYFTNMGVPLVAGRDFDQRDREGSPCVAIVNEAFAQRYLSGIGSALGRRLTGDGDPGPAPACEIVGVIRDNAWQSLNREVRPLYALPVLQSSQQRMTLLLESSAGPTAISPAVRQVIRRLDPRLPVAEVQTLQGFFDVALYPFRLFGFLMAGCGALALLLAVVGVYGTVSYSVAQRQREVGIRMAIGAERRDILRLIVGQGMKLVGYGLVIGLVLSLALTRILTNLPLDMELLFGVGATDAITFAGVTVLLGFVALGACTVPAWRATKVDPMVTLRDS